MAKKQNQKKQEPKAWMRGQEIPETLTRDAFAAGLGIKVEDVLELASQLNIQPLWMRADGQTKGYPSTQLFMRSQIAEMIAKFEEAHQPPPPTPEQMIAATLQQISSHLAALTHDQDALLKRIDNFSSRTHEQIAGLELLMRSFDMTPPPLAAMTDNANEVSSAITSAPEGARLIRRRHTQ
jgi:hypothetical protein